MKFFKHTFHFNNGKTDFQLTLNFDTNQLRIHKRLKTGEWKELLLPHQDLRFKKEIEGFFASAPKESIVPFEDFVNYMDLMYGNNQPDTKK